MEWLITIETIEVYEFTDAETGHTYRWNATEGRRLAEARGAEFTPIHLADLGMTPQNLDKIVAP